MALTFLTDISYTSLLTTSISFITSLILLKSIGTGTNLSTSNLSNLFFKLFKPLVNFSNLLLSSLSIFYFQLAISAFSAKSDVPARVAFFFAQVRFFCIIRQNLIQLPFCF